MTSKNYTFLGLGAPITELFNLDSIFLLFGPLLQFDTPLRRSHGTGITSPWINLLIWCESCQSKGWLEKNSKANVLREFRKSILYKWHQIWKRYPLCNCRSFQKKIDHTLDLEVNTGFPFAFCDMIYGRKHTSERFQRDSNALSLVWNL